MGVTSGSSPATSLADLVDEITRRLESGEQIDFTSVATANPEHAEELQRLMPTLRMLADWSHSVNQVDQATPASGGVSGILGDFRIIRLLGRGGMGIVYEAEQISLSRRVALKVLPFASNMDPKQLQRFQNEARSAASLHHPNIVPVHAVGCERGVHYFAMQYIDGLTIADFIRGRHQPEKQLPIKEGSTVVGQQSTIVDRKSSSDFQQSARIGIQAARALEHAHTVGIVHRDIKPSNLILDSRGDVWVADFGLARSRNNQMTTTGDLVGTLRYMSPEQAMAQHDLVDHRTDVYSLGASLYELLTTKPAIEGEDTATMLRQIANDEPKSLRAINASIPLPLETIVLKAMAKEPGHRYATAADLADDLQRYVDDLPIRAKRPSVTQRIGNWTRRHRAATWSAVGSVLLVSLVTATTFAVSRERIRRSLDAEITANNDLSESLARERAIQAELRISLARSAWTGNRLDEARRHLDECPVEQRGFEWFKVNDLVSAMVRSFKIPSEARHICMSSDEEFLAYSWNKTIYVCDMVSGEVTRFFHVSLFVNEIAFTRDCQKLVILQSTQSELTQGRAVAGAQTGSVSAWDWRQGELLWSRDFQFEISQPSLSPRAERYAANRIGKTNVFDTFSGELVAELDNPLNRNSFNSSRIVFSRNAKRVGASATRSILLWEAAHPKKKQPFETPASHRESISDFSDDGNRMLTSGTRHLNDNTIASFIKLHDIPGERVLHEIECNDTINASAISHDGTLIAYLILDRIELIDANNGRPLATLRGHTNLVRKVWFSPDGNRLYSESRDNSLRVWNISPWKISPAP